MKLLRMMGRIELRIVAAAVVAIAILHICATLAAPHLAVAPAYSRLAAALPLNTMKILPPVSASSQPLPFAGPDSRYAMCRFETTSSPVALTATLPDVGWTLALYSSAGENIYAASGQYGQRTDISIKLIPSGDLFSGLSPESRGLAPVEQQPLAFAAKQGVAVLRAPDRGFGYQALTEQLLKQATCAPIQPSR